MIEGRAFVPFGHVWGESFPKMEAHALLEYFNNADLLGNLLDFFEGNLVLVGDVAIGSSDLGHTPLEADTPLLLLHAAMLNGLLTNRFYRKPTSGSVLRVVTLIWLVLSIAACIRSSWFLYAIGAIAVAGLLWFTWNQLVSFRLFPVSTIVLCSLFVFAGLVIGLEIVVSKEHAFIRNAFAKYVPEGVVKELLKNPGLLKLGGEEREVTVLFSDLAGFTSISENMSPPSLARLLNEYLTEMTNLVFLHDGIIDKYEGDAIMAEFGAPLTLSDHATRAVETALQMQWRLKELRQEWNKRGLPSLQCRIGINTGMMVVGNMGSHQVFDYTVIGDLLPRLEGANKVYGTSVMISQFTRDKLDQVRFRTRALDVIKVKGKSQPVKVFEVYGNATRQLNSTEERYYQSYHRAFECYLAREFSMAQEGFEIALSLRANDPASSGMLAPHGPTGTRRTARRLGRVSHPDREVRARIPSRLPGEGWRCLTRASDGLRQRPSLVISPGSPIRLAQRIGALAPAGQRVVGEKKNQPAPRSAHRCHPMQGVSALEQHQRPGCHVERDNIVTPTGKDPCDRRVVLVALTPDQWHILEDSSGLGFLEQK